MPVIDHMMDVLQAASDQESLKRSILKTLTYADVFDYPLTLDEIHRYLVEKQAAVEEIRAVLSSGDFVLENSVENYTCFAGRRWPLKSA
jgi:hypothetical protein